MTQTASKNNAKKVREYMHQHNVCRDVARAALGLPKSKNKKAGQPNKITLYGLHGKTVKVKRMPCGHLVVIDECLDCAVESRKTIGLRCFMTAMERTRTEKFPKNQVIECEHWKSFVIVGETINYHEIRFRFDRGTDCGIQSRNSCKKPDSHKPELKP